MRNIAFLDARGPSLMVFPQHSALILSDPHLPFQSAPLHSKVARDLSRHTEKNDFCTERVSPTWERPRPMHTGPQGKSALCLLNERSLSLSLSLSKCPRNEPIRKEARARNNRGQRCGMMEMIMVVILWMRLTKRTSSSNTKKDDGGGVHLGTENTTCEVRQRMF